MLCDGPCIRVRRNHGSTMLSGDSGDVGERSVRNMRHVDKRTTRVDAVTKLDAGKG